MLTTAQTKLIDAFEMGDLGQVEFFELALDSGMTLDAINAVLEEVDSE